MTVYTVHGNPKAIQIFHVFAPKALLTERERGEKETHCE